MIGKERIFIKNKYIIHDEYAEIFFNRRDGKVLSTKIDIEDLQVLLGLNVSWYAAWNEDMQNYYAQATKYLGIIDGKPKYTTLMLHKVLMNAEPRDRVDHINHDILDNRKSNLRKTNDSSNAKNRLGANKNNKTGVRNVCYDKKSNKYIVQLISNGKNTCFGRFDTLEEAAELAEKMRKELYKEEYELTKTQ